MKLITDRNLMRINFAIVFYFVLIYTFYVFQMDFVLIGVIQEMLTIPFLIAQVVFVVIGVHYVLNHKKKRLTIISLLALIVCSVVTVGTFF